MCGPREPPQYRVSIIIHRDSTKTLWLMIKRHDELDAEYYISKNIIPPLERIFNLVGANVRNWYDEMPKVQRIRRIEAAEITDSKDMATRKTLESYMKHSVCVVCRDKVESELPLCVNCLASSDSSVLTLQRRLTKAEKRAVNLERVCRSCAGLAWNESVRCDSKDCPVFYTRTRHTSVLRSIRATLMPVKAVLENVVSDCYDW